MKKVLIVASPFTLTNREPIEIMTRSGLEVEERDYGPGGLNNDPSEFHRVAKGADALIVTATEQVDRQLIESTDRLRMVACRSAGFDRIDLDAGTERGVLVTHNPGANRKAVGDMAIGLMLCVCRKNRLDGPGHPGREI